MKKIISLLTITLSLLLLLSFKKSDTKKINETEIFTVDGVSFTMIKVEGGTFSMGATAEQENEAWDYEKPVHKVTLSDYYIGTTEVTQALWKAVMGESVTDIAEREGSKTYGVGNDYPMYYVSWDDVQVFLRKLNAKTGKEFRLPTEAEWEFAARGGKKSKHYKYAGNNNLETVAWYVENSNLQSHLVAQKQPNELELYDMSGNVWEWCSDWYGDFTSHAQTDPKGSSAGFFRVSRGGSWFDIACDCRVSSRNWYFPNFRINSIGFRLALNL